MKFDIPEPGSHMYSKLTFRNPENKCLIPHGLSELPEEKISTGKHMSKTTWSFGTAGRADVNRKAYVQDHTVFRNRRTSKSTSGKHLSKTTWSFEKSESKSSTGKEMLKASFGTTGNNNRRLPLSEPLETIIEDYLFRNHRKR